MSRYRTGSTIFARERKPGGRVRRVTAGMATDKNNPR
jgi:hypothetical protein